MKAFAPIQIPLAMLTSLTLASGLGVAWAPAVAQAADNRANTSAPSNQTGVAQLNEEGAALYAARDYRRAIEKFIQAYAVDTDPNLLFNIARCYEELGEIDAAIEKYETFLKTPGADTRGRQRARESLAALREARDNPNTAPESSPTSAKPLAAAEDATSAHEAEPAEKKASPILPWLVLGGSAAFAAVGTTFYLLGASDHGQVTDARGYGDSAAVADLTRREADDLVSSGDTKKLIGGISFGLAGALAATYVVLLVSADDEGSGETGPSLGFSVVPSPDGTAVMAQGSF
jgi:tetratricopeptide (TPR) repeat protein